MKRHLPAMKLANLIRPVGSAALLLALPLSAFAAFPGIKEYLVDIRGIINTLIVIAVGAAVAVFFWGLVKFIAKAADSKSHEEGRSLMVWGSIALFVIASIGGIIWFIQSQLGIYGNPIPEPTFGNGSSGGDCAVYGCGG